jgi:hypothetical protein
LQRLGSSGMPAVIVTRSASGLCRQRAKLGARKVFEVSLVLRSQGALARLRDLDRGDDVRRRSQKCARIVDRGLHSRGPFADVCTGGFAGVS